MTAQPLHLPPLERRRRIAGMIFIGAFIGIFYQMPLQLRIFEPHYLEATAIDRAIPFVEWTVWFYCSYYIFLFLPFAVCKDDIRPARALYSLMAAAMIACLIFVLWPTRAVDQVVSYDGPTGLLWNLLQAVDRPGNYFPSLHVANACIVARALTREGGRWRWIAPLWAFAIIVSTVTTKQHFFIDVPAGIFLGWFCVKLVRKVVVIDSRRWPLIYRQEQE
jgi:membrane-associated phospholipid phosphatase